MGCECAFGDCECDSPLEPVLPPHPQPIPEADAGLPDGPDGSLEDAGLEDLVADQGLDDLSPDHRKVPPDGESCVPSLSRGCETTEECRIIPSHTHCLGTCQAVGPDEDRHFYTSQHLDQDLCVDDEEICTADDCLNATQALCQDGQCVAIDQYCNRKDDCQIRASCCACFAASASDPTSADIDCPVEDCLTDACSSLGLSEVSCIDNRCTLQ